MQHRRMKTRTYYVHEVEGAGQGYIARRKKDTRPGFAPVEYLITRGVVAVTTPGQGGVPVVATSKQDAILTYIARIEGGDQWT